IVSEAFEGREGESALSSYGLEQADVELISGSVPDHQTAACWVAVTRNSRYAYTTNTGSGSISGYRVSRCGGLDFVRSTRVSAATGGGGRPTHPGVFCHQLVLYDGPNSPGA